MINSFWTLIDNNYYRVKDGILLKAEDNSIDTFDQVEVELLSSTILDKINYEFGTNFKIIAGV